MEKINIDKYLLPKDRKNHRGVIVIMLSDYTQEELTEKTRIYMKLINDAKILLDTNKSTTRQNLVVKVI